MQLVETELFSKYNFKNLYFAGHPEGNKDIDPDGTEKNVNDALIWKQKLNERTDINLALTTQFCFDSKPVIKWANELNKNGINIPIHIGVAGPAKLQTLIKFSIACGVGASLKVLHKRAKDIKKLLLPFEPNDFLETLALHKENNPNFNITNIHFFSIRRYKNYFKLDKKCYAKTLINLTKDLLMTRTIVESKSKTAIIGFDQPFCA